MNKKAMLISCGALASIFVATPVFATNPDSTEFSVEVKPYLNVTLSNSDVHLPITPSSTGAFGSAYLTASASTNSALGYSLNLSFLDSNDNLNTDLISNTINVNDGTYPTIPTFTTNDELTSDAFSASTSDDHLNHWAISIDDTNHYKKALTESTIATSNGPIADDATTINLATKLDLRTTPGSYSVTMKFEVVANPDPDKTLEDVFEEEHKPKVPVEEEELYRIQDMTTGICEAVTDTSATLRVVDVRDNNIYTIGKLADGKCWLLDNLRLDPTDSTVASKMKGNTNATDAVIDNLYSNTSSGNQGWSTNAIALHSGSSSFTDPLVNIPVSVDTISNDALDIQYGWKKGAYYNFCAVSAGTYCYGNYSGVDTNPQDNRDISYDICPTGWQVPTTRSSNAAAYLPDEANDFYNLYYRVLSASDNDFRMALHLPNSGTPSSTWRWSIWTASYYGDNDFYRVIGYTVNDDGDRNEYSSVRCIAR